MHTHKHTHTPHGCAATGNARQYRHDEAPTAPSIAVGMSSVLWAPRLCPVTPVCAPQPCRPHPGPDQHAAAALPGPKGCQEARLQAAEARWREFLDVHHSQPRSWTDPSCPTSSGWGGGRGPGARWEGSRPPSRWGGRSGQRCWGAGSGAAEVKRSKEEEQPAEAGGREMVGDRRLAKRPREERHNGGKSLRGHAGGSARP